MSRPSVAESMLARPAIATILVLIGLAMAHISLRQVRNAHDDGILSP